jgi:hypothetical protein
MPYLYEVEIKFTPDDPEIMDQGVLTVQANSEEDADTIVRRHLDNVPGLQITRITELYELPNNVIPFPAHQTLQ